MQHLQRPVGCTEEQGRAVPNTCARMEQSKITCRTEFGGSHHTLMDIRTDLTAVPNASLRDPNPERSRKVLKNLEVCKKK